MAVPPVTCRDPRVVPEFTLWTMNKDGRTREARTRVPPVGAELVELAIYELQADGTPHLVWAITLASGLLVHTLAWRVQREYEGEGWATPCLRCNGGGWVCEAHPNSPFEHLRAESISSCAGARVPCCCEIGQKLEATLVASGVGGA